MGTWGPDTWDNDTAADWFADLFDRTPIVDRVLAGLRSTDGDVVRSALWLSVNLCRGYVWPIERFDETLEAAIRATEVLLDSRDNDQLLDQWESAGNPIDDDLLEWRTELLKRRPRR